jgi:hypothetical protein
MLHPSSDRVYTVICMCWARHIIKGPRIMINCYACCVVLVVDDVVTIYMLLYTTNLHLLDIFIISTPMVLVFHPYFSEL